MDSSVDEAIDWEEVGRELRRIRTARKRPRRHVVEESQRLLRQGSVTDAVSAKTVQRIEDGI